MANSAVLGDVKDLQAPVLGAWQNAQKDLDAAGIQYRLTSGYRSPEEQAKLYQEWQMGVPGVYHPALPGHSRHQAGTAIDLEFAGKGAEQGKQILASHGFQFTGGASDPVHYDFVGGSRDGGRPQTGGVPDPYALLAQNGSAPSSNSAGGVPDPYALLAKNAPSSSTPKSGITYQGKPLSQLEQTAVAKAQQYGVDPTLYLGIVRTESGFRNGLTSSAGAQGLAQFMPGTWKRWGNGADIMDPTANLDAGARYFASLQKQYGNDADALAAYNGSTNLPKARAQYVGTVQKYQAQYGGSAPPTAAPTPSPSNTPSSGVPDPYALLAKNGPSPSAPQGGVPDPYALLAKSSS